MSLTDSSKSKRRKSPPTRASVDKGGVFDYKLLRKKLHAKRRRKISPWREVLPISMFSTRKRQRPIYKYLSKAAGVKVTNRTEIFADEQISAPSRTVVLQITGSLKKITKKSFVIDWYGGGELVILRSCAKGGWEQLQVGQWFTATILRAMTGEVVSALLVETIDAPRGFSGKDLEIAYKNLPAAKLDPVK
jgi:hypothetical protein